MGNRVMGPGIDGRKKTKILKNIDNSGILSQFDTRADDMPDGFDNEYRISPVIPIKGSVVSRPDGAHDDEIDYHQLVFENIILSHYY